ncbi:hypothetical protein ACIQGZ_17110 [Streptomyces sp. NPDC092296]|uniref:hypothetical protein n=1 Tax=Streptomyces sp. NPDC092296 TaxID=3366012 RepID=UPI0038038C6F
MTQPPDQPWRQPPAGWAPPPPKDPRKRQEAKRNALIFAGIIAGAAVIGGIAIATDKPPAPDTASTSALDDDPTIDAPAPKSHKPKKPPTAEARKQAAAILKAEDQRFRDQLAAGERVVGTVDFTAWYKKAIRGFGTKQEAFAKADALFTAENEPSDLIEAWREHNGDADAAITTFAEEGTAMDAPNAKTRAAAKEALADLAKADRDADRIAAGE